MSPASLTVIDGIVTGSCRRVVIAGWLLNKLTQANWRFIKCLRYNLPSSVPTASVLLTDKDKTSTALFICPPSAIDTYRNDLNELIENNEIKSVLLESGNMDRQNLPIMNR